MRDRHALILAITILAVLALGQLVARSTHAASPGLVPGDYCLDVGEAREPWSDEAKKATRERVRRVTDALGVAEIVADYQQLVLWRESFGGEASVRHTLGQDVAGPENGLGPHGLSLRWHRGKWDGDDLDPALCTPEVSAVIVHEIMWRAVTRYGARNLAEIQAVYAGAVTCSGGECLFTLSARKRRGLCARARRYGHDCGRTIRAKDLGRRLSLSERRTFALGLARAWVAEHLGRLSLGA